MSSRTPPAATVTGPAVDRAMRDGIGPAFSYAITCAARSTEPGTWYVRDETGETVARVEKLANGQTLAFGAAMIAAERRKGEQRPGFVPGA